MMHNIVKADITHVEVIRCVAHQTWWPTYSPILAKEQISFMLDELYSAEKISNQITTGAQTYLILTDANEPVAFAAYAPREEDPEVYKLHKLYCLPKTQGKGFGKILINEVIKKTAEARKHRLDLNVNRYNNALSFYQKMGFAVIAEEDIAIGPYWMNDYVMRYEW